jgi:hypothetical protein
MWEMNIRWIVGVENKIAVTLLTRGFARRSSCDAIIRYFILFEILTYVNLLVNFDSIFQSSYLVSSTTQTCFSVILQSHVLPYSFKLQVAVWRNNRLSLAVIHRSYLSSNNIATNFSFCLAIWPCFDPGIEYNLTTNFNQLIDFVDHCSVVNVTVQRLTL